jgi:hypothetical protein
VRILFIGDIVGSPGRQIVHERLADLVSTQHIDLVIANCENAASGFGITPRLAQELLDEGIHVLTGGNHIFDRREILDFFPHEPRLLRPANFPASNPGSGLYVGEIVLRSGPAGACGELVESVPPASSLAPSPSSHAPAVKYAVLNLQGRVFMAPNDCPFKTADRELARIPSDVKVIVVDMHAEATSEKVAMGWYLDGRVTAVIGTHTHVASADERVLPGGTAVITDVGFTGPHNGIIGMERTAILHKFVDGLPTRFSVADADLRMNCALLDADPASGKAQSITRLRLHVD